MANSERLYFFDNLRAFVIVLVIVLHASITYMAYAPTWWYVLDPQNSYVFT
jgi:glucan biosynthesis protein C